MLHDYGSRDQRFIELTSKVRNQIVDVFPGGQNSDLTAVLLQGSGTFAVEAMIAQFVPLSGGKLVILSNGAYGRRMADICKAIGRSHVLYESPEDEPLNATKINAFLQNDAEANGATHVAVIHCETTTGVLNPLREIATVVESNGKKLLVDAMSAFGVIEVDPSTVKFEALAASSNKGLQGPPGVGFVVCTRQGLEKVAGNANTVSLDLSAQHRQFEATGEWRFTPPTHVMLGLAEALDEFVAEGGTVGRRSRYASNCTILVEGMRKLGFETLLENDQDQAPVIVTFRLPSDPNFEFQQFYDLLSDRGFMIYPGKVATAPTFRVGCIGDVHSKDMYHFLDVVRNVLTIMGVGSGSP